MNTMRMAYSDFPGITRKAWFTGRQVGTTFLRPDQLRTINDTRGVVGYDLAIGDIVQFDPFSPQPGQTPAAASLATTQAGLNATLGLGPCVGAPNIGAVFRAAAAAQAVTAIGANAVPTPADIGANTLAIQPRLFVVTHLHTDVNRRSDTGNANSVLAQQRDGGWVDICPIGTLDALFFKNTDVAVPMGQPLGLFMPATSAAVGGVFTFGSTTLNTGKPAFTNLLDADLDITLTTAATTVRNVFDVLSRIQATLMESVDTNANGGGAASTTSFRKVSLGGPWCFGV